MADHKLRPEEVERKEESVIREGGVGVFCTKMTDPWAVHLAAVIASRYCCKCVRYTQKNKKVIQIGFVGLEEDFEICKRIFLYAYECVQAKNKGLRVSRKKASWSGKEIREMCNAYGWGFCTGLSAAFQKQEEEHQEWDLVMVVPQAVEEATSHWSKPSVFAQAKVDGWRSRYAAAGIQDGKGFHPDRRLASKDQKY